jgi:hypothetical protein
MPGHWENVTTGESLHSDRPGFTERTDRLAVPGGWLYRTIVQVDSVVSVQTVFVPDPNTRGVAPRP